MKRIRPPSPRGPSLWVGIVLLILGNAPLSSSSEWTTRKFGAFLFHYRSDEEKLIRYLCSLSREIEERVEEDLGLEMLDEIRVTIASTHDDFLSLQNPDTRVQEWVAGLAYSSQDKILMKSPRLLVGGQPNYEKIFFHEVAHVALDQAFRRARRGEAAKESLPETMTAEPHIPRWLHEGYAIYVAREWSPSREVLLTRAVLKGKVLPLGRLVSTFPEEENLAQVAYAQSADLVHYLINSYGNELFHRFILALGKGYRFGHACRETFGLDFHALEEAWFRHLKRRYTWIPLLSSTGTLWFLACLIFVAAYVRKKVASRAKVVEWSEEGFD